MLAYSLYAFLASLYIGGGLCAPMMLAHHAGTAVLAVLGGGTWSFAFAHYYCPFFFGLAELANLPLAFVDVFKFFPKVSHSYARTTAASRVLFAGLFLAIRIVYWSMVSARFWRDCFSLLQAGGLSTVDLATVLAFLFSNLCLTGLQYLWGMQIRSFLSVTFAKDKCRES